MRSYRPRFYQPKRQSYLAPSLSPLHYNIDYTPREVGQPKYQCGPLIWMSPNNTEDWETGKHPYFVAEVSELGEVSDMGRFPVLKRGTLVTVKNKWTNKTITFEAYDIDYSDSGEDIAGWRFRAIRGNSAPCEMLIIND